MHKKSSLSTEDSITQEILSGNLSSKYAYLGSGYAVHLKHASSSNYVEHANAAKEISEQIFLAVGPRINSWFDLGPGDGYKTQQIYKNLIKRKVSIDELHLIDISREAIENVSRKLELQEKSTMLKTGVFDLEFHISEFLGIENNNRRSGRNLLTLLGNTIGNLASDTNFIISLANELKTDDVVIFTCAKRIDERISNEVQNYRTEVFRDGILTPFRLVGLDLNTVHFESIWIEREGRYVSVVTFLAEQPLGEYSIPTGHKVECFTSRRYTKSNILRLLKDHFSSVSIEENDESYIVCLTF